MKGVEWETFWEGCSPFIFKVIVLLAFSEIVLFRPGEQTPLPGEQLIDSGLPEFQSGPSPATQTHTFLPWTPMEIIHSRDANQDGVSSPRQPGGMEHPALRCAWVWLRLHLLPRHFLHDSREAVCFNFELPRNQYTLSPMGTRGASWEMATLPLACPMLQFRRSGLGLRGQRKCRRAEIFSLPHGSCLWIKGIL